MGSTIDIERIIVMAEIKMNKKRINMNILHEKSKKLLASYPDYEPQWLALGIEDISRYVNISIQP
jgi:hypothetical protein